jgi:predicted nucleotidyltransferase
MNKKLNQFTGEIKLICPENLKSIILYGSQASQEAVKYSDYNLLLIFDKLSFAALKNISPVIKKWIKQSQPAPLIFTKEEFIKSADVFPIDFSDIKDRHIVLFGENPLANLKIELTHLRHECEFELRGKLLKLRQGFLASQGNSNKIKELLINSISSMLVIFRNVLRLLEENQPLKKLEALGILETRCGLQKSVFENIFRMKQGDKEARKLNQEELFEKYLVEIGKIISLVDGL